ncbi:MAG: hypothetical protein CM1200mP16_15170 [Nitrospina sp.]|nr:MAG: hypothetical protein CM1200mP16_15170 [Nitrospina sp.]
MEAGADDFYVVVGYKASFVRSHLEELSRLKKVSITVIENEEWERANGISGFKGEALLKRTFFGL